MKNYPEPKIGRSILKCDFGTCYNPHVSKDSARRALMNTINNDPVLLEKLIQETNYQPRNKTISPKQQKIIIDRLGEPELWLENSHVRKDKSSRESCPTLT